MTLINRILSLPNDRPAKALLMALMVGFCCALLISTTAVILKPKHLANIALEQERILQQMLATLPGLEGVLRSSEADTLDSVVIDLDTGLPAESDIAEILVTGNDTQESDWTLSLNKEQDIANISTRPRYVSVYLLQKDGELSLLILPVYGTGYQSTIKAWLTLEADLSTVAALSIYEQGETPGIGSKVTEQAWLDSWSQKQVYNDAGDAAIRVVRGKAADDTQVDGISGATRTGQGINTMLSFWLSDLGFGRFLDNLRDGALPGITG